MSIPSRLLPLCLAAGLMAAATGANAEPLRIGYWPSGFSLGFGAVLEEGQFAEEAGLEAEYVRFSEVAAPARAVLTGDIDVAFAAPAAAAFNLGRQDAPIRVILITQLLDGAFVVPADSEIQDLTELAGARIGMSPVGSSTHAIVAAILKDLHGLEEDDYTVVPGNEGQLAQLLSQGEIDAAALRSTTIVQIDSDSIRPIAGLGDEWRSLTGAASASVLAVALTRQDVIDARQDDLVAFIRATLDAVEFGSENPEEVTRILRDVANLDEQSAADYAALWDEIYTATLTAEDVETLKETNQIFVNAGAAEGVAGDEIFATGPFEAAIADQ